MQVDTKQINAYIDALDAERAEVITKLFNTIKKALPKGFEATISYGMVAFVVPFAVPSVVATAVPFVVATAAAQVHHEYLANACIPLEKLSVNSASVDTPPAAVEKHLPIFVCLLFPALFFLL